MSEWYFTERGEKQGPVSTSELKERAQNGSLTPDDLVWKEGMADWAPASSVKGLLPAGESAPPVKPARRDRDDDDPDDDRPRKRRRQEAGDDDDRPRSRRNYDDYDNDRPRRRRGPRDFDDDERPRRRRPQPAMNNVALWVSLGVAVFVVLVIFIVIIAAAAHDDRKIAAVPPPRPMPIKIQPPAKPIPIPPVQPPPQPVLPPNPPLPQNIATPTDKAITLTAGKGTWNGNLDLTDPFDPRAPDCHCKVFFYPMKAGTAYTIDMTSVAIDSYLRIEDPSGNNVAEDDDSGGQLNARLVFIAERTGTYRIVATTFVPNTGAFQLRISP